MSYRLRGEKLWQHEETGRMVWHKHPGPRYYEVQVMFEDELPGNMTDEEYDAWFENSHVPGRRRMPHGAFSVII